MTNILIATFGILLAALVGSIVHRSHKTLERFNLVSEKLRIEFRKTIDILNAKNGHPATVIKNDTIDNLVSDVLAVSPVLKRKAFIKAWEEYRYDKEYREQASFPSELARMGTADARRLIEKRIHTILSTLK